jgi:PAS domain S-box-containing protein
VPDSSGKNSSALPDDDFRALVQQAADGIFISTADGHYLQVNPSGHRLLGYAPGELVGKSIVDLLPAREIPRLQRERAEVLAGAVKVGVWTFIRKDGTPLEAEVTAQRLSNGRMMAIVRELVLRSDFERRIRESQEKLRSILATAPDVVMTVDRAGTILFINRTLPPLSPEQVVGTNCFDYVPPESRARVEAALDKVFTTREIDEYEVQGPPGPTGERVWSSVRAGPLVEGGRVVAATLCATDVTRRKEHEAREARLQEQLRQAQKLESIGRLAGGVAHDFNNLLTSIMGYAEMAREALPAGSGALEHLAATAEAARRGAALTQQLLAFARKKIVHPEVVVLNDVLEGMTPLLRRLVGENIDVQLVLAGERGAVNIDVGSLEQVIMNLVVNAKDAISGAGRIVLETRIVRLDDAYCREHPDAAPGEHVVLAVRDTGSGMTGDVASHIFEPFFTTKPVGAGTGLGLAMCEGIVRQAGGSISVESAPDLGTTFRVHLPRVSAAPVRASSPAEPAPVARGTETLLLVEDENAILNVERRVLSGLGYEVLTASNGADALELAKRHSGPIDLLLTDVVMPRMGGRELAAHLTALRPALRVLFSSGYTADTFSEGGVLVEEVELLQKPYSPSELAARVRLALDAPPKPRR